MTRTLVELRTGIGTAESRSGQPEDLAAFDFPTSPEITQCPYAFYEALRREAPVYKHPHRSEYLVARRQDILHVVQHPEIFSSDLSAGDESYVAGDITTFLTDHPAAAGGDEGPIMTPKSLVWSDPPDHTIKRRALAKVVSRERIASYEPLIESIAHELIDGFIADGVVEFRSRFADQLAVRTICAAAGFPPEAGTLVMEWSRMGSRNGRRYMTPEQLAEEDRSLPEQAAFVQGLIADRLANPTDDFLTEWVQGQVERDGELNLEYLVTDMNLLLTAGNETTSRLITNTMLLLLQNPEAMEQVLTDPPKIPDALEESLRFESPTQWVSRYVTQDTEIAGVAIPQGAFVVILLGSANNDETLWDDPNSFRLDRPDVVKYHMGFGGGVHLCVGAPLARQEARIGMTIALDRLRNLRLAPGRNDLANIENFQKRVPEVLHLEFDPMR
jgi:cytochrome P450